MPHTPLLFRDHARGRILAGASALADAVHVTLGPTSQCVLIERFDAACGPYTDLIEAGITDPTQVVRLALENAASVTGTLLLAEATLTETEEKSEQRAMPEPESA